MTTIRTDAESALVEERLDAFLSQHDPSSERPDAFWSAQFDAGLAWVQFEEGHGGLGVSPRHQRFVNERLRGAGVSSSNIGRNILGHGMGAPTVAAHGTDEQKQRWLKSIFTAEEIWCQLFSEPGAGSDAASIATRATRDGEEWVVNGQKVWTTLAHTARRGMLVARTDPDVPKHRGLTYFIMDMASEGVEVRPLRQITGEAEFNEVYMTDVRIPDSDRLGDVGDGWRVAVTTLMNERVAIGSTVAARESGAIGQAIELWRKYGHDDPVRRDRLMHLWIEAETLRLTNIRAAAERQRGTPGPAGSTGKLKWADLNKEITEFSMELLGADGLRYPSGYEMVRPEEAGLGTHDPQKAFLRARANSIEGGTSEIMKNILGERVLGLPGEPRVDKDVPWIEVPRN